MYFVGETIEKSIKSIVNGKVSLRVLATALLLVGFESQAAINLEKTLKPAEGKSFGDISSMVEFKDGIIVAADKESGTLLMFSEQPVKMISLSDSSKVFSSDRISGLSLAGDDMLAVSNSGDGQFVTLTREGELITRMGNSGSSAGKISEPHGIAYSNNRRIYIADTENNRISIFGADGVFLNSFGQVGLDEKQRLRQPLQVFVDPQERVYVFEKSASGQLSIFDYNGELLKRLDHKSLENIVGDKAAFTAMSIDSSGLIYLADSENGRVFQIDWRTAKKLSAFGSKGEERGQFSKITALLSMSNDRVAVADSRNNKIEIYKLPSKSSNIPDQVRLPTVTRYLPIKMKCDKAYRINDKKALCLNRDKNQVSIYSDRSKQLKVFSDINNPRAAAIEKDQVVILDGNRIKLFDIDGNKKYEGKGYAGEGSGAGKLSSPSDVYLRNGKIYIADTGNRRIQIFSSDGIYLDKIENVKNSEVTLFEKPISVVVDAQENIFIADKEKKQLHVFSKDRQHLYSLGGEKAKVSTFNSIYGLAMDDDNNLYVLAGTKNNKYSVQVYNGPKKVISFASESESDTGIEEPENITVASGNRALVGVYDSEKERLLNFSYLQVPAQVGALSVVGTTQKTELKWTAAPGSFIKGYNIYGADELLGDYQFVTQVYSNQAVVEHESQIPRSFYKVNAFTGLGSQGKFSRPQEDVFIKGYKHYQNKEYQKVVDVFEDTLSDDLEQPETLKYLGLSLLQLDKLDAAVQAFREMTQIKGYENQGLNLQIKALVAAEDYIAAKALIDKVIEDKTAADETYVFCGDLSLRLGDPVGAITCLEVALEKNNKNIEAHFLMGDAYVKLGIVDKGLQEFDKAAELAPDNADVWYRSGLIMRDLDKIDTAIERFTKTIDIDKKHLKAKLALAQAWLSKKEFSQVKTIAISLAGQSETAADGQYLLGLVAIAESKNGEALLALVKATRLDKTHANAWMALADTYVAMGQQDKLRPSLESAVKADPLSFDAAMRLGEFELEQQQYEAAAVQLSNAVKLKRDSYQAKYLLSSALFQAGDYNQAFNFAKEANKQKPDEVQSIVLLADISNKQGKIGKAIDFQKKAMDKQPDSMKLTLGLGKLYSENNLFDQAKMQLEKAALLDASSYQPHLLLGGLYLKRRLFDQAIASYDKAVALEPSADNKLQLDKAYAEKKKSLEFKSNAPQIVLKDLHLEQIFSAAYKQYADKPVGRIRIQNTSGVDYGNLKLTFSIKGYMDFPTTKDISKLAANETQEIDLLASFNNRILEIDEDTGVQVEVALNFVRDGRDDAIKLTQPMTIYGKNAILWGQPDMVGSFVTPKDDTLRDFVRQAINENKPEPGPLSENLVVAMTLFDVLTAHGIRYVVDPNSPYSQIDNSRVDYVQFSRETLKIKSGDCDDLSVLLSAGLENLGIKTAILDVPGHLLMMFDSGVSVEQKDRISLQEDLMVERNGMIWIPIEATMIGTSFAEAWAEGARKYVKYQQAEKLAVTELAEAWKTFLPVTLKPANYSIDVPDEDRVKPLVNREQAILLQKSLDRLVKPYEVIAASHPQDIHAKMQVAIIYAKYGLYSQANVTFEEILQQDPENSAVHNNRGNIYYAQGDFERAIETYSYAEQLAANDPGVKVNMAMSYYQLGKLADARAKFDEAKTINQSAADDYAGLGQLLSR